MIDAPRSQGPKPEVRTAIIKGALGESVLLAAGTLLYFATGQWWWLLGGVLLGAGALLFMLMQAGAFDRGDE